MRQLELQVKAEGATAPLTPFAPTIVGLEESRRRMEPIDPAKTAAVLAALGKQVDAARTSVEASLRSTPVKKTVGAEAAAAVTGLRATLRRWFDFYNGYDPLFTWWAAEPFKSADASLQTYATFLRERIAGMRAGRLSSPLAGAPAGAGGRRGGGGAGGRAATWPRRRGRGGAGRRHRRHRGESDRPRRADERTRQRDDPLHS